MHRTINKVDNKQYEKKKSYTYSYIEQAVYAGLESRLEAGESSKCTTQWLRSSRPTEISISPSVRGASIISPSIGRAYCIGVVIIGARARRELVHDRRRSDTPPLKGEINFRDRFHLLCSPRPNRPCSRAFRTEIASVDFLKVLVLSPSPFFSGLEHFSFARTQSFFPSTIIGFPYRSAGSAFD